MRPRLAIAALVFLAVAGPGWIPYYQDGAKVFWKTDTIPMAPILPSPGAAGGLGDEAAFAAIGRAMDRWNAIPCDHVQFRMDESVSTIGEVGWTDGTNRLGFQGDLFGEDDSHTIAVTMLFFEENPIRIEEADIYFNTKHHGFTLTDDPCEAEVDLEGVAFHELGHVLGLDHTSYPEGSMFPYYTCGFLGTRTPTIDEARGICAIYGGKLPEGYEPVPGGGEDPLDRTCPSNAKCVGKVYEEEDPSIVQRIPVPPYKPSHGRTACSAGSAPGVGMAAWIVPGIALVLAPRFLRRRRSQK